MITTFEVVVVVILVAVILLLIILATRSFLKLDKKRNKKSKTQSSLYHQYETIDGSEDESRNLITQTLKICVHSQESILAEKDVILRIQIEAIPAGKDTTTENASRRENTFRRTGSKKSTGTSRRYSVNYLDGIRPVPPPKTPTTPQSPLTQMTEAYELHTPEFVDSPDTVGYVAPNTLKKMNSNG